MVVDTVALPAGLLLVHRALQEEEAACTAAALLRPQAPMARTAAALLPVVAPRARMAVAAAMVPLRMAVHMALLLRRMVATTRRLPLLRTARRRIVRARSLVRSALSPTR